LLTTHYIEEAEQLCQRVAIMDEGRIIVQGTPRELQERVIGKSRVEILCQERGCPRPAAGWPAEDARALHSGRCQLVAENDTARAVVELVKWVDGCGPASATSTFKRPTLEDVFIELTGKKLFATEPYSIVRMKPYIAYIRTTLRLTGRERIVIFFNYLFPLAFLIGLGGSWARCRSLPWC